MINYISLKKDLPIKRMEEVISAIIQAGRQLETPIWILGYRYKNSKGDTWIKGVQALPNQLIQEMYWTNVIPNNQFIVDLTECENTVVFDTILKIVRNPKNFYWIGK